MASSSDAPPRSDSRSPEGRASNGRGRRLLSRVLIPDPFAAPGSALAALLACLALTPSLLPRAPAAQGLVCGIVAAAGYGIGRLVPRLTRRFTA